MNLKIRLAWHLLIVILASFLLIYCLIDLIVSPFDSLYLIFFILFSSFLPICIKDVFEDWEDIRYVNLYNKVMEIPTNE